MQDIVALLGRLESVKAKIDEDDKKVWAAIPDGLFSVQSCVHLFDSHDDNHSPWKAIWYTPVPLMVRFFMWTASMGKILMIDMLRRKWLMLTNYFWLCKADGESASHSLLHCPFTWEVWLGVLWDFGMRWTIPPDLHPLFLSWKGKAFSMRGKRIWNLVPAAVCWSIWLERNRRISYGYAEPSFRVYQRTKDLILMWAVQCKDCELLNPADLKRGWEGIIGCHPLWFLAFDGLGFPCWAFLSVVVFFLHALGQLVPFF